MIDKFYLMRKEFNIKQKRIKEIKDELFKKHKKEGANAINDFITKAVNPKTRQQAFNEYPEMGHTFRAAAFSVEKPKKGKRYRNNKVIDMSWGVLTHETATHRLMNPGGFDPQKRMGYMVTAYKMGKGSWEYLETLDIDTLKDLCYTDKNLVYMDVNTQFYEQNNVAGTILGMFAVQKIAHAVLEGDKNFLDVSAVLTLGENTFRFAGHDFVGLVEIDPTKNSKGEYIGKILGSLVASAADAVKDPVLNLMNINSTTAPILTTMIRMGIPFETAAMLMSQRFVGELLQKYNMENLAGKFTSFEAILNEEIENFRKEKGFKIGDELSREELTKNELSKGLGVEGEELSDKIEEELSEEESSEEELIKDSSVAVYDKIRYKGMIAIKNFLSISKELKGLTYATRFNSISNAVGPQAIDNIIMQSKLKKFSEHIYQIKTVKEGNEEVKKRIPVTFDTVFKRHHILAKFRRGLDIAQKIFGQQNIPVVSSNFESLLANLPDNISEKLFADKKLFSKFVDFYLSYLLVTNGCIKSDEKTRKFYIEEFPSKLFERKIKDQYPDNPFIQALRFEKEKLRGGKERLVLKINTTGMSQTDKEKISSGWADLHKVNPKLSVMFFEYCFFKGGIGFTPKTFMHLMPLEVKMQIENYLSTYRKKPSAKASLVIDQFIRNNWFKNKIVPVIEPSREAAASKDGKLILSGTNFDLVAGLKWCRIRHKDGSDHLYEVVEIEGNSKVATLVERQPLGNNGEYLEISLEDINPSEEAPTQAVDNDTSESTTPESSNQDVAEEMYIEGLTSEEVGHYSKLLAEAFASPNSVPNFRAKSTKDKMAVKNQYKEFFAKKFKEKGITYDESEFEKLFKTFCGE